MNYYHLFVFCTVNSLNSNKTIRNHSRMLRWNSEYVEKNVIAMLDHTDVRTERGHRASK